MKYLSNFSSIYISRKEQRNQNTPAAVSRSDEGVIPETSAKEARAAANIVTEAVTPRIIKRAGKSTDLWVDDRPKTTIYERQALEALGVSFVMASSTEEAMEKLEQQHFDAIISDMKRPIVQEESEILFGDRHWHSPKEAIAPKGRSLQVFMGQIA